MTAYIFPGQGSQCKGMGGSLFDEFPEMVEKTDAVLGYSIKTLCLEDPQQQLNQTQYTQPALYVVNTLSYLKKQMMGQSPDIVAGHSLGEYNALLAANVFDFETGLKLVKRRGELMSQANGGGMAAVVGLKTSQIESSLQQSGLANITIANYNSHTQMVLSGPKYEIDSTQPLFENAGAILFMPLKVSGAFHSAYMQPAQQQFESYLKQFHFSAPTIPVIANLHAKPYQTSDIILNLANQITQPVRWTAIIEHLLTQGESTFEEIGPGQVLTGLIRRIRIGQ